MGNNWEERRLVSDKAALCHPASQSVPSGLLFPKHKSNALSEANTEAKDNVGFDIETVIFPL